MKMVGSVRSCCVPKCGRTRSENTLLHSFPHPVTERDRFTAWINAVGSSISSLSDEHIYKNRKICSDHFEPKFMTWKGRLSNIAVPTLLMPRFPVLSDTVMRDITNIESAASGGNILASASTSAVSSDVVMRDITNIDSTASCDNILASTSAAQSEQANQIAGQKLEFPNQDQFPVQEQHFPVQEVSENKRKGFQDDKTVIAKLLKKATQKNKSYSTRLKKALNLAENKTFQNLMSKFTSLAAIFISMQFREIGKKKMGRRFTDTEKIMALSLYKYGPRLYRFMSRMFVLPSPLTLSRLIQRANIKAGINEKLFRVMKKKVKNLSQDDKLCVLLFDEMAISPHFAYNMRKDVVSGFTTNGEKNDKKIADHALVFMIRGIVRNYKQPIAYTFTSGSTKKEELVELLQNIIKKLHSIGLRVLATVCDQGASNVSTINFLINKTRMEYLRENKEMRQAIFNIDGQEIIPLYDPPHLIKGIRNNLLIKNLQCTINGVRKTAKWEHLSLLQKEDPAYKGIRLLHKLSEDHINPERMKMKVKYATQIFSSRVAATMGYLARKEILPEECTETADILLFFDELFDSINGSKQNYEKRSKILLDAVKPHSRHKEIWANSKKILSTMKFVKNGKNLQTPSVNNWLHTMNNMEYLRDTLFDKYNIKSIWMRHFNQDPLENFFGCIRSHGCRNVNPTPEGFEAAFASLLINNMTGTHSPGYNCENDSCESMFKNMKSLFKIPKKDNPQVHQNLRFNYNLIDYNEKIKNPSIYGQLQYVTGYLLKNMKKHIFHNCPSCKTNFYSEKELDYLHAREFDKNKRLLTYPRDELMKAFSKIQDIISHILKHYIEIENIAKAIKKILHAEMDLEFNTCKKHKKENIDYLFDLVTRFFIFNWTKDVNNILRGRRREQKEVLNEDIVKNLAIDYFNKRRKK